MELMRTMALLFIDCLCVFSVCNNSHFRFDVNTVVAVATTLRPEAAFRRRRVWIPQWLCSCSWHEPARKNSTIKFRGHCQREDFHAQQHVRWVRGEDIQKSQKLCEFLGLGL
eukprot:6127187-Amphidinium_carterae.1